MMNHPLIEKDCRGFAAIISFILTFLLGWDALINNDGMLYVYLAQKISVGDFQTAFATYTWLFYPTLIAGLHQITGLGFAECGLLINAIFYAVMVAGFISVIQTVTPNRSIQFFAAIAILIFPAVNDYRAFWIRDAGFWGLTFWALFALIRFHDTSKYRYIFLGFFSFLLSTLFRIEALVLWILAPLGLYTCTDGFTKSIKKILLFQSPLLLLLGPCIYIALTSPHFLGRLHELPRYFNYLFALQNAFEDKADAIAHVLSPEMKEKHAWVVLLGGLSTYLFYLWVCLFSPIYLAIMGWAVVKHAFPAGTTRRYCLIFISITVITLLLFLSHRFFLSSRYLVMLSLLCLVWVPFGLYALKSTSLKLRSLTAVALIYLFLSGVTHWGYDQDFFKTSGYWLKENIPAHAVLLTNDKHIDYYAGRYETLGQDVHAIENDFKKRLQKSFKSIDAIAVYYKHDDTQLQNWLSTTFAEKESVDFHNKRGDGVRIIILK